MEAQIIFEYDIVILITGCRYWSDYNMIFDALTKYKDKYVLLIHGDCKGADKLAGEAATKLKFEIDAKPADWNKYGRAAGPIRNTEMVKQAAEFHNRGVEVHVLAFHDDLQKSVGTKHCVNQAKKYKLNTTLYSH